MKRFLLIALLFASASLAQDRVIWIRKAAGGGGGGGAVTFDAFTESGNLSNTTSCSVTHSTANQPNRVMLILLAWDSADTNASSVTVDGSAATSVRSDGGYFSNKRTAIWRYVAPAVGSNSVSVTWSTSGGAKKCVAVTAYNVNQSAPVADSKGNGTGAGENNVSYSIATPANGMAFDILMLNQNNDDGPWTPGAGQTQYVQTVRWSESRVQCSRTTGTSLSWTIVGANKLWSYSAVALSP